MLKNTPTLHTLGKFSALLFLVTGVFFAAYTFLYGSSYYPNIVPAAFLDSIAINLDWANFGTLSFPIQVDNFLVFQEFHSTPPGFTLNESYLFGGIVFLVAVSVLALASTFKKNTFPDFRCSLDYSLDPHQFQRLKYWITQLKHAANNLDYRDFFYR